MTVTQSRRRLSRAALRALASQPRLIEPFNVDEPRYLLGQVAFATGMSSTLLKAWIARKIIPMGEHDREAHGKGSARVFTFRRALAIGLAAELVKLGFSAAGAGRLGTIGVDVALFASESTLLVVDLLAVYPTERGAGINVAAWNSTIKEMLGKRGPKGEEDTSVILLSALAIAKSVLRRLGELE
jgi:hypothetical protein